jgi:L-ectoine synthase
MIVKELAEIVGSERHVSGPGWESRRILLKAEGLGYSLHDTLVREGAEMRIHFRNHIESNYCIAGEGEVVDVKNNRTHQIRPGTLYALDQHDEHILRATKGDLRLVCVFTPALSGHETHDNDGGYALIE